MTPAEKYIKSQSQFELNQWMNRLISFSELLTEIDARNKARVAQNKNKEEINNGKTNF